jgi:hypothetical protein
MSDTDRAGLAPTLSNWDRRLTLLAAALAGIEVTSWLGSLWTLISPGRGEGVSKSGFVLFSARTSVYLLLIAVIVALLPEIISGVARVRTRGLVFVFVVATVLGAAHALVALGAAAIEYTDPLRGYRSFSPLEHLATIAFGVVVAALGVTGLSDGRFVPGLGGFRPTPPRPDLIGKPDIP